MRNGTNIGAPDGPVAFCNLRDRGSHTRRYGRSGLFHIALDSHSRDDRHAIGTGRRYVDRVSRGASHPPIVRHDLRTKASQDIGSRWHSDVEGSAAVCRVVERGERIRPLQHDATWHAARCSWGDATDDLQLSYDVAERSDRSGDCTGRKQSDDSDGREYYDASKPSPNDLVERRHDLSILANMSGVTRPVFGDASFLHKRDGMHSVPFIFDVDVEPGKDRQRERQYLRRVDHDVSQVFSSLDVQQRGAV